MRPGINIHIAASIAFSIITLMFFWAFSSLFAETAIFYVGLPFALSAFLFSYVLLRRDQAIWSFKIERARIPNIILCVITVLSVLAVLFVPAYDGSILEWMKIPLTNWLRYAASTLLTLFLPGYFLLKIFDSRNSIELSATIPLSYVLSMFMTFVTGFGLLLASNSISSLASFLLIAVNLTLMVAYYVQFSLNYHSATVVNLGLSLTEFGALLVTLVVTLVGNIYVMIKTLPLSVGDMWFHLGLALQYSKGFPIHGGILIPGYPYLFHVYLATFFQLSGLPPSTSYQALFALSFISVLSFYSFIKRWFSKENVVSIAVILVSLLGFGSLYALSLKFQNPTLTLSDALSNAIPKTYDIYDIMVIGPVLSNVVPILFIALPTLIMFLYLLRKNMNGVTKSFLFTVLVAVSFLGHVDASFFMGLALLLYSIVFRGEGVKTVALGGILGLSIVPIIDFSAPAQTYLQGANRLTFIVTFLLFVLSYVYSVAATRIQINSSFFPNNFKKKVFFSISSGIIGAYLFSLITWFYVLPSYNAYTFGGYNFTPFFVWAIRFGPIGLLSILCLSFYLGDVVKDKRFTFFLAIAATGFAMEQLANYYPIYPAYRFATLMLIGVVALAAYFVSKSSFLFVGKKRIVLTAFLILIMIPGMLTSSLYYYKTASTQAPTINNYELAALNFVRKNLPSNSSVLTFTTDSEAKLETFAGVNTIQGMITWNYIFLNDTNLSTLLYLLGTSNVKYIYLTPDDFEALNSSKSMLKDILNYFPVSFQNDAVTICEIPPIAPPSTQSNFVILNPLEPDTTAFEHDTSQDESVLQTIPSLLQLNYTFSSLPTEDNTTYVAIEGFQNSSQWATVEGIGGISLNETTYNGESTAIAVYNLTADNSGYFAVGKVISGDFTQFDYLHLWIEVSSDVDGELKVILQGDNGTWDAWLIQNFTKNEWFPLTLQLTKPDLESTPQLDLSAIRQVDIGFQELIPNANYSFLKIAGVQGMISSPFLPYGEVNSLLGNSSTIMLTYDPDFDASSLSQLAESGREIIVFDTNEDNRGFFFNSLQLAAKGYVESNEIALSTNINIPQVQVRLISANSSDVLSLSYYKLDGISVAPFVMVKKMGLGEITYIMLPSNVITALEETVPLLMTIFKEIADMRELQIEKYEFSPYPIGSYDTLEGLTTVNGKIEISAEHIFSTNPLQSSRLEIRTENTSEVLANVTIDSLEIYGPAKLVLDGQSTNMQANSASSYVNIFSDALEYPCILELSDNTMADLSSENSSKPFSIRVTSGSLIFNTSELSILANDPSIEVQGDICFESARIQYTNPYVPLAGVVRDGLKISGHTVFTVQSLKDLIVLTGFSYNGIAVANNIPPAAQLNISWLSLLVSPTSFAFYLLLLVFALFSIMGKQVVRALSRGPKIDNGDFVERVIPGRVQYPLWQEHINRYFFALTFVSGKVVLDVACGTGYGTELISKTADLAIGVDISREALAYAEKHYGTQHNTAFVLSDACNLPFRDRAFDTVVSFETIEHLAHSELFLQDIKCVLKINGTLIVSTPNSQISSPRKETPQNPYHLKEFNIEEFSQLLSLFFTNLQFYGQNYYTIETWLLRFLGEHLPFSFKILFGKISTVLFNPSMPQREMTKTIDPAYGVGKLEVVHPIYSPQFLIALGKNRKPSALAENMTSRVPS